MQFGTHQVPWTGRSPGALTESASHAAFCLQDSLQNAMKSKEMCQEPLKENQCLGMSNHKNNTMVTLTEWITSVALHMCNTGMDAMFFMHKQECQQPHVCQPVGCMSGTNSLANDEIDKWLADKTNEKYDRQNLEMLGTYLQNSTKIDLWKALEQTLQGQYEGPRIFTTIVWQH